MTPQGLGTRQAKLIRTLAAFEKSAPEKDAGLSTIELAKKVFGRRFTPSDRVQTARSLNRLLTLGMIYQTKKPMVARGGNRTVYWRIHPRIAELAPIRGGFRRHRPTRAPERRP